MMDLDKIEAEVRKQIVLLGEALRGKNAPNEEWTKLLKLNLQCGANELGLDACATHCKNPEWLYDVTWVSQGVDCVLEIPMVLESEWCFRAIGYDFDKLLLARAGLRVMVFEGHRAEKTRAKIDQLKNRITMFLSTQPGDRYLFASWENHTEFKFERYIVPNP
jgi:hypothetical protein